VPHPVNPSKPQASGRLPVDFSPNCFANFGRFRVAKPW
jgi:hypothetical protein